MFCAAQFCRLGEIDIARIGIVLRFFGQKFFVPGSLAAAIAFFLSACITVPAKPATDLGAELAKSSEVSVASPGFQLPAGASFSWRQPMLWTVEAGAKVNPALSASIISREIQQQLQAEGHQFVASGQGEQFTLIAATFILEKSVGRSSADTIPA